MSTRSILAFETEVGIRGVSVHYDGYPQDKLPTLAKMVARDGAPKVTATILAHPDWASLEEDQIEDDTNPLVVTGYGRRFDDGGASYFTPTQLQEWWDSEYAFVMHPETGAVRWVALGIGHQGLTWEDLSWRTDVPEWSDR